MEMTKIIKPFEFEKIADFDLHIQQSIPGYTVLQDIIVEILAYWMGSRKATMVDLGCSTGSLLRKIKERYGDQHEYRGIEKLDHFVKMNEFTQKINLEVADLDWCKFSIVLSLFTFQFLERKEFLLKKILNSIEQGDIKVAIIAEKIINNNSKQAIREQSTITSLKRKFFSEEEIYEKEQQLKFNMYSETEEYWISKFNSHRLQYYQIWSSLCFRAYLVTKES